MSQEMTSAEVANLKDIAKQVRASSGRGFPWRDVALVVSAALVAGGLFRLAIAIESLPALPG
jgi:hypothetical protein